MFVGGKPVLQQQGFFLQKITAGVIRYAVLLQHMCQYVPRCARICAVLLQRILAARGIVWEKDPAAPRFFWKKSLLL